MPRLPRGAAIVLWVLLSAALPLRPAPAAAGVRPIEPRAASCQARLNDDPTEYATIQEAVDASTSPDDLVKVAGYCAGAWPRGGITQTVYLSKTLTLQGGYTLTNWTSPDPLQNPTTLDALGQGRVLYVVGEIQPRLIGLRVTGGDATEQPGSPYDFHRGGGLCILSATVTISRCAVYGNTAGGGGGVFAHNGVLTLYQSALSGNAAEFSGGGMLLYEGTAWLEGSVFISNTAGTGGGAYLGSEAVTLTANAFLSNTARYDGGGVIVEVYGGHSKLVANHVAGNRSYWNGGGLYFGEGVRAPCAAGRPVPWRLLVGARDCPHHPSAPPPDIPRLVHRGPVAPDAYTLLDGNLITGNWARNNGGGLFTSGDGGAASLEGNTVLDNTAGGHGGGICVDWSAENTPLVSNTVSGNTAQGDGGGIYMENWQNTLRGNVVQGNTAGGSGGGLALETVAVALTANRVVSNTAQEDGGGILVGRSTATLVNNWIVDNRAGGQGGGLALRSAIGRLWHNTIADNHGGDGSGIALPEESFGTSTIGLTNTILAGHAVGITVSAGSTATLQATLWGNGRDWGGEGTLLTGTVNLWGPPAFANPAGGDYHLGYGSAALDAGIPAGIGVDIDGQPRPLGRGYELGADEAPIVMRWFYLPIVGK